MSDTNSRLELSKENKEIINQVFKLEQEGHKDAREVYAEEVAAFLIKTNDGSYTLKSDDSRDNFETLHSIHGAITESFEKFVKPSKLDRLIGKKSTIRVLDICSGVGYNASALLEYLLDYDVNIEIDMVESSIETLATTLFIPSINEYHDCIKKSIESYLIDNGYLKFPLVLSNIPSNVEINLNVMDAREFLLENNDNRYDAVFLDPYSPSKCPELYSVDFFRKLKDIMTYDACILTYTAASPVRSAMVEAGFEVGEGPRFHRSGGTIASLSYESIDKNLSFSDVKVIALSDVGISFSDSQLNGDFEDIVKQRQDIRKELRGTKLFPSSSKLPRYLGVNPEEIGDDSLRVKLTNYVKDMGFSSLVDSEILYILDVDLNMSSKDQIFALKKNLKEVLDKK